MQFELLSHRNYLGASIVALIITFAMMGTFFFLALYMQNILHYSPLQAGVRFLPSTLMIVAVAPISGRLADRFGPRWLIAGGLTLLTASLLTFTQVAVDSTYTDLLPGFVLLGIGIALTMSPMTSAAMNAVPVQKAGVASGVLSMFRMVGGSLGVAVTGAIFQSSVGADFSSATPQEFVDALSTAMGVSAAVTAVGGVVGALVIRTDRKIAEVPIEVAEAEASPGRRAARRPQPERAQAVPSAGQARVAQIERGSVSTLTAPRRRSSPGSTPRPRRGVGPGSEDDHRHLEAGAPRGLQRQQGVVDRAETGRGGDDQGQAEVDREVADRIALGERHQQAADPLADELIGRRRAAARRRAQPGGVDLLAGEPRREMG